jgi:hypothetical protein
MVDLEEMLQFRLAMQEAISKWLYDPNVSYIDVGRPEHDGEIAWDELEVCIHVREKIPLSKLNRAIVSGKTRGRIPKQIQGAPVDIPKGDFKPHLWYWGWGSIGGRTRSRTIRLDPINCGSSIGNGRHRYSYGTLGAIVEDKKTGRPMLLSDWHVLAGDWGARRGQRIYQPAQVDGGGNKDWIADLERDAIAQNLDAAVAFVVEGSRHLSNEQYGLGTVKGSRSPVLGLEVHKSGRVSNITSGKVTTAIAGVQKMTYQGITREIRDVWRVEPPNPYSEVSRKGDSGSLWLERQTNKAVGLHFSGTDSPERALMMDIKAVMETLDIDLISQQNLADWNSELDTGR